ncbi:MAG TPA: D-alanyl-D-alanine carboxypeptidase family protein [Candidatus Nitrosotalea sp.]|nr:D-alanyl-D-alanine carboxypeptidase family protein [Candidatus Nitrosotalea sp.]
MLALALISITVLLGAGCGVVGGHFWLGVRAPVVHLSRTAAHSNEVLSTATRPIRPLAFSSSWLASHPPPDLGIAATEGIEVDLDSGRVLWERAPDVQRAPASLTKMVTAMVALDLASMGTEVTVSALAAQEPPDLMGLSAGEVVSVRDLMYGMFLDSGNDAAEALADGLVMHDRFIALMNAKARAMGLLDLRFMNPTGLDQPGHQASAYDLAVIAASLVTYYPELLPIADTRQISIPATASHKAYQAYSLDKMLWSYPGAVGLKTGFTDAAGGCVASLAVRGKRRILAVVMNSDVFFTDAGKLLDYGFSTPA